MSELKRIRAIDLKRGMAIIENEWVAHLVLEVRPSDTGKTVLVTTVPTNGDKGQTRRYHSSTEFLVDDSVHHTVIADHWDGHSAVTNTDEEGARRTFGYFSELMEQGEYKRVLWERSTNGGYTWAVVREAKAA